VRKAIGMFGNERRPASRAGAATAAPTA
jgi:hypothetical protein